MKLDAPSWIAIALGALGVVVSWVYFAESTLADGFVQAWVNAFTGYPFSAGLHWDLVFSLWIVCVMAVVDRVRLGRRFTLATIALGCTLGVCAALPAYWIGLRRHRLRTAS